VALKAVLYESTLLQAVTRQPHDNTESNVMTGLVEGFRMLGKVKKLYLECVLLCRAVSQCVLNVLVFYFLCETDFFRCSACAFDMCLLNYLLTYLLKG